jgi:hypothetical protein
MISGLPTHLKDGTDTSHYDFAKLLILEQMADIYTSLYGLCYNPPMAYSSNTAQVFLCQEIDKIFQS